MNCTQVRSRAKQVIHEILFEGKKYVEVLEREFSKDMETIEELRMENFRLNHKIQILESKIPKIEAPEVV